MSKKKNEKIISVADENGEFKEIKPFTQDTLNKLLGHGSGRMITSGKIKDTMCKASYFFLTSDGIKHEVKDESADGLIHDDLKQAFKKLIPHLIIICDQKEIRTAEKSGVEEFDYDNYEVTGFVVGGTGEDEGVVLIGRKIVDEKALNLTSPFRKWSDGYKYASELADAIEACKFEVEEYLKGKYAVKQTNLEFESAEAESTEA